MLCDDFNDKYFSRIIAHLGDHRDVHALIGQGLHALITVHRVTIAGVPNFKMAASCSFR